MNSMTGFGTGEAPLGSGRLVLDVRSVNHRFLDVRVRVPQDILDQSLFLEQRARERLSRGRFDITVRYEGPAPESRLDTERARALFHELERLRDELAPGSEFPFAAFVGLPALYTAPTTFHPLDVQKALASALEGALARLDEMRLREGAALEAELRGRLDRCRRFHAQVSARVPDALEASAARLRSRVARLITDVGVTLEPGRLEAEMAILVDRTDIAEELVRLASHFSQVAGLLGGDVPVGRRLDFLLQEMARESNTIGAKCQDAEMSHLVVELRSEIERMREQVQNVE